MTVHKLTAGDGYTYLTRHVASADERRPAGQSLADYYVARGNPPGVWMGRGAAQLGVAGTTVSEAQMKALFGEGRHPDRDALVAAGAPAAATKLGAAYPSYADLAPYPDRVAQAVEDFEHRNGRPPSATDRNQIAAKEARRGRRAVAGFDLVFTPVKSASILWGIGGPEIREQVEAAHHAAVSSALAWIEQHASYTRTGHGGVAQIDATGLVCAAFDHRESRSGDPDLHTHVAVANKVCGVDGKWRSLDARSLYALGVAGSERYNTRFEDELARRLGVRFIDRPGGMAGKRPVREVSGMPAELIGHFSRRRAAIETRLAELRAAYRATHGREPDQATQLKLAQQATLETREGKGPGRTLAEQVADWTDQARDVLGLRLLARLVRDCTDRPATYVDPERLDLRVLAGDVVRAVSEHRSTWSIWNVHAETERRLRPLRFRTADEREDATQAVVGLATSPNLSIRIAEPALVTEPTELVRASDGQSVYVAHGAERYTTSEILLAEDALVDAGRTLDGPSLDPVVLEAALAVHQSRTRVALDPGQRDLVTAFACSPARLVVGIGAAGAGKTTAMRAFTTAWQTGGRGRVVPLATSSKAAQVLGAELGARAENLHKFLHENTARPGGPTEDWFQLRAGDIVLVDEAGMAGTLSLARLLDLATTAGAAVRLLGDPAQLAAVDAGGALALLEREVGAVHLTEIHRFSDPAEARATLALRSGDPAALDFYRARGRIHAGSRDTMLERAYDAWAADARAGRTSVLIAATGEDVTALNGRARTERAALGQVEIDGIELHDGNLAGVGDWVVTRQNARTIRYHRTRWVHNGDTWRVTKRHSDGSLTLQHLANGGKVHVNTHYASSSVELAYAATAHRVQGTTTDTAHALVTPEMTREALYVASTRGRHHTSWYVATETPLDADGHGEPDAPRTVEEVLAGVLARTGAETSATHTLHQTLEAASKLPVLITRYEHARHQAALDALPAALATLPDNVRRTILNDPAAPQLARAVADAASRGAAPTTIVRDAYDLEPLTGAPPAAELTRRIDEHPVTLGIPRRAPINAPLPWLPGPDIGHHGWEPYLRERASLIKSRANELGTLASAYREHYDIHDDDPHGLGVPPEPGSRRDTRFGAASAERERRAHPTCRDLAAQPQSPPATTTRAASAKRGI